MEFLFYEKLYKIQQSVNIIIKFEKESIENLTKDEYILCHYKCLIL